MEITYNNKPIQYNQFLSPSQTTNTPSIKISDLGYNFYTLIMYDPDAIKGTYWHWILANIKVDNNGEKDIILDYQGPNPPDAKKHRYIFELYGTNNKIITKTFDLRALSLEQGKKLLNLENGPIISTQFLSQREKGGKKTKKNKMKSKVFHKKTYKRKFIYKK